VKYVEKISPMFDLIRHYQSHFGYLWMWNEPSGREVCMNLYVVTIERLLQICINCTFYIVLYQVKFGS
jgi:hypothetical protein